MRAALDAAGGAQGRDVLRLEGAPYLYDPARGTLLLDVTVPARTRGAS